MGQSKPLNDQSILIVDDEALFRFHLADFFADHGFKVYEAEDADQAIQILESDPAIGIVLTDVRMPGEMDGLRLAHVIRDRYPPVLLLVASGFETLQEEDLPSASKFLRKPFNPHHMLREIDRLQRGMGRPS